jgi:hypothetical protein
MITVKPETRKNERYCATCAPHRKPNYDTLAFIRVELSTDANSRHVLSFCSECATELVKKLAPLCIE